MKKFMQILLATFGVMALVFAGCTSKPADDAAVEEEGTVVEEETTMEEEAAPSVEEEEAEMKDAE